MYTNQSDRANEHDHEPVEIYRGKITVDKQHLRNVGIQKGTSVEVKVYEYGSVNEDDFKVIHVAQGRYGAVVRLQPNEVERYNFDHIIVSDDEMETLFGDNQ